MWAILQSFQAAHAPPKPLSIPTTSPSTVLRAATSPYPTPCCLRPPDPPRPKKSSDKRGDRRPYCHKRILSHPSWHHSDPVGPDFGRDIEANSSIRRFIVRTCRYQFGGMLLVAYSAIALYSPVSCTCTTQCRRGTARRHRGRLQIPVSALPEKSTQGWGSPRTCGSRRR